MRYSLFAFNDSGAPGGYADFDSFSVEELHPHGLMRPIPAGHSLAFTVHDGGVAFGLKDSVLVSVPTDKAVRFTAVDCGLGRVALRAADGRLLAVQTAGGKSRVTLTDATLSPATTFQWIENVYGDLMLLSVATDRYLRVDPATGAITADHPGPAPDRHDGSCFDWKEQESQR